MLTSEQIAAAVKCQLPLAVRWTDALNVAMDRYTITTPKRQAAFLAQISHESAALSRVAESLNYTPEGLMATFNTTRIIRFTKEQAARYGRTKDHPADQKMIANTAYANRMGNGSIESGDGWTYRGRGPGQLTGKENIGRCGKAIGVDLLGNPALLERPDIGAMSFAWFWSEGNPGRVDLNAVADAWDITRVSAVVNGGNNGLQERIALSNETLKVLA